VCQDFFSFLFSKIFFKRPDALAAMTNLLIDTDAGVDDAVALTLALTCERCRVVAVTCCWGNTALRHVEKNVARVLRHCNAEHVPLYIGCAGPLVTPPKPLKVYPHHGPTGLGTAPEEDDAPSAQAEHAALAIIRLSREVERLHVITLGPLTNLAVACTLDPGLPARLASVTLMGGCVQGRGNSSMIAEFNVFADPEACKIVLERVPVVTMVPWELFAMSVPWPTFEEIFDARKSPLAEWFRTHVLATLLPAVHLVPEFSGPYFPDAVAMAALLEPTSVADVVELYGTVETAGEHTRGASVFDWAHATDKKPNIRLVRAMHPEPYFNALRSVFHTGSWK
jgi:purine nucleosidase